MHVVSMWRALILLTPCHHYRCHRHFSTVARTKLMNDTTTKKGVDDITSGRSDTKSDLDDWNTRAWMGVQFPGQVSENENISGNNNNIRFSIVSVLFKFTHDYSIRIPCGLFSLPPSPYIPLYQSCWQIVVIVRVVLEIDERILGIVVLVFVDIVVNIWG